MTDTDFGLETNYFCNNSGYNGKRDIPLGTKDYLPNRLSFIPDDYLFR